MILDNQTEGPCECSNIKCGHHPYHRTPWIGVPVLSIWMVLVGISFIVCCYALASGKVRNGFSVANTWGRYVPYYWPTSAGANHSRPAGWNITSQAGDPGSLWELSDVAQRDLFPYAFVFRFLPTYFAGLFALGYLSVVDVSNCFVQPFVGMYKHPGSASETILLDYLSSSALKVPLKAWDNSHWRVAWFSVLGSVSSLFPIFVGGLFSITVTAENASFKFSIPAFSIVFTFLVVYCGSLPFVWPTANRSLPRASFTLADVIIMCYRSNLLWRPDFDISHPKTTNRHMACRIFLREDSYLFGSYFGTDREQHLGFDVADARGEKTDVVRWITPKARLRRCRPRRGQGNGEA